MDTVIELDERGHRCPLPVVALGKAAAAHPGATVRLLSDDPVARLDVPAWCWMKQATLLDVIDAGGHTVFVVALPPAGTPSRR